MTTREEVDLMFWQFCYGIQQIAMADKSTCDVEQMNKIAEDRFKNIKEIFNREPSFHCVFTNAKVEGRTIYIIEKTHP